MSANKYFSYFVIAVLRASKTGLNNIHTCSNEHTVDFSK